MARKAGIYLDTAIYIVTGFGKSFDQGFKVVSK
jgi:hypothetical protein